MAPEKLNLDDIFRKKLEEATEDKMSWEAVNSLLDKQEKRRRGFIWFFSILGLLLISTGVYFGFLKNKFIPNGSIIVNERHVEKKKEQTKSDFIKNDNNSNKKIQLDSNELSAKDKLSTRTHQAEANVNSNHVSNHSNDLKQHISDVYTSVRNNQNDKDAVVDPSINSNQPTTLTPTKNITQHSALAPENESIKTGNDSITLTIADSVMEKDLPENNIQSDTLALSDTSKNQSSEHKISDSIPETEKQSIKSWNVSALAGVGYYFTAESFSPAAGININKKLNEKLSIDLSVYYSVVSGLDLKDSSISETYFLDKETSKESLVIKTVNILNVPIWLRYQVFPKNNLLIGVNFYYLIDSKSTYSYGNGSGIIKEDKNASGYMDGLNQFNYAIQAGYTYSVSKNLNAGLIYQKRITNPIDEEHFGKTSDYFNSSLTLFVFYKFY